MVDNELFGSVSVVCAATLKTYHTMSERERRVYTYVVGWRQSVAKRRQIPTVRLASNPIPNYYRLRIEFET
jgi:hypothetical protein